MKIIKCNTTFAIQMTKKQFLKWDTLNQNNDLAKMLKNGFDSILKVDWDLMYGGGPNLFITTENESDIPLILQRVKFMLNNL